MTEAGFTVETNLPFAWQPGCPNPAQHHGSLLLLRVVNLLDSHEPEQDRAQERVEARLDLMLHWLGMQLFGHDAAPSSVPVRLEAERIEWLADTPPETNEITLNLFIHPAMAAPLKLAGKVEDYRAGRVSARLRFEDEQLSDAWTRWLFRRHRRAVHEARSRAEAGQGSA